MKTVTKQIEVLDHFRVDLYVRGFESRASDPYSVVNHSVDLIDTKGNTYNFPANQEMIEKLLGHKNPKLSFEVRLNDSN